jgi:hypothetical protein
MSWRRSLIFAAFLLSPAVAAAQQHVIIPGSGGVQLQAILFLPAARSAAFRLVSAFFFNP